MIISVASGKGGTGKTTIATNLALSLVNAQLLDCDVEEPNAAIFIQPEIEKSEIINIPIPEIDQTKCNLCGKCADVCAFNAIAKVKDKIMVFSDLCHGCGSCAYFCPQNAIKEVSKRIGVVESGANKLEFMQGKLDIGQAMAPPLIKAVKKNINSEKIIIIDAPPGTSCPVITAITGSDFCVLVTEPTPFGLNDLKLAVQVLRKMKILFGVVINRSDLGNADTQNYCNAEDIPILMQIPFSKKIAKAYSKGISIIHEYPEYKVEFQDLYQKIKEMIEDA